jgi:hypothetical protein
MPHDKESVDRFEFDALNLSTWWDRGLLRQDGGRNMTGLRSRTL